MRNKKEGKKKRTTKRQRKRKGKKGEAQKRLQRKKGKHRKINKKCLLGGVKTGCFCLEQRKQSKKTKTTTKQKNQKEGLGPSEVALWATSPDP